jgi:hypothetical protein
MGNLAITQCDTGAVEIDSCEYKDELLTFAGLDTFKKGTLLARQRVNTAITPAAGANTGNGTCTLATVTASPNVPKAGTWVLRCQTAVANGGVFRLEDPDGAIVASGLTMTVGAGAASAFEAAGLAFTLTDGAVDFVAGDSFNLPVVANGKLVPFAIAGAGGAQYPLAVLGYEVSKDGAGDLAVRPIISGKVNRDRLIIDLDGTGANITDVILDQLRAAGVTALKVGQISIADNQ